MKKYEYKFVRVQIQRGFDFEKKLEKAEEEWNALGREGWQFCANGNDCTIFMRELKED